MSNTSKIIVNLQNKVIHSFLKDGKKKTGEKIFLRSLKLLQKQTKKSYINLIKRALVVAAPVFKVNQVELKKGKRKTIRSIPIFIANKSSRIMLTLKALKQFSSKAINTNIFYQSFAQEILNSASGKSKSVEQKVSTHKQTLMNKRYLAKFRW